MAKKTVTRTPAGKVMEDLIAETTYTFFLLRTGGAQSGAISPSVGSYWGLLRSLKLAGPQTVPQIARSRPVSRQSIQKLANECLKESFIELIDNPAHQRSKLLRLTAKGEAVFQKLNERLGRDSEPLAENIEVDVKELQIAVKVLRQMREKLGKALKVEQIGC